MTSSTTKQFTWKDRDSAAHDLLQLVYYAPPSVAGRATNLLSAIRSPAIIPELLAVIEDPEQEMWQRIRALRAIAATSGDRYLPQLKPHMEHILAKRRALFDKRHDAPRQPLIIDTLDDIAGLVAQHPSNHEWFFEVLDHEPNLTVLRHYLQSLARYWLSEPFRQQIFDYVFAFFEKHPEQLTPHTIKSLLWTNNSTLKAWLHQHIDDIVRILAIDVTHKDVLIVAHKWDEIRQRLSDADNQFDAAFAKHLEKTAERRQKMQSRMPTQHDENTRTYRQSSAYRYLTEIYQQAQQGNDEAYSKLVRLARRDNGNIHFCAAATHLIGKLRNHYDVKAILFHILKYGQHDQDSQPSAPSRFELNITHIWGGIENEPCGNDIFQALPPPPECFDTGFTIRFTTKKAAKFGNGAYRFP